jgi:hypothetical protein
MPMLKMDPQALYVQIGRLIEAMPDLAEVKLTSSTQQWFGRAYALVDASGELVAAIELKTAIATLEQNAGFDTPTASGRRVGAARTVGTLLHRVLALLELQVPAAAQGAFIPAGNAFDAMAAMSKVLGGAKANLMIVDPYMDEKALTDFALLAPEGVSLCLLADRAGHKATLAPAAQRWITQYGNDRPLEVRLGLARALHDRLIIVDHAVAWDLTQSLNAFAVRAPASIIRHDGEAAVMKIEYYKDVWQAAEPI